MLSPPLSLQIYLGGLAAGLASLHQTDNSRAGGQKITYLYRNNFLAAVGMYHQHQRRDMGV